MPHEGPTATPGRLTESQLSAVQAAGPAQVKSEQALNEILFLLQSYAPAWFTKEHEARAREALQREADRAASLESLYLLLEEYAPAWYTQEQWERTKAVLIELGRLHK